MIIIKNTISSGYINNSLIILIT